MAHRTGMGARVDGQTSFALLGAKRRDGIDVGGAPRGHIAAWTLPLMMSVKAERVRVAPARAGETPEPPTSTFPAPCFAFTWIRIIRWVTECRRR